MFLRVAANKWAESWTYLVTSSNYYFYIAKVFFLSVFSFVFFFARVSTRPRRTKENVVCAIWSTCKCVQHIKIIGIFFVPTAKCKICQLACALHSDMCTEKKQNVVIARCLIEHIILYNAVAEAHNISNAENNYIVPLLLQNAHFSYESTRFDRTVWSLEKKIWTNHHSDLLYYCIYVLFFAKKNIICHL